MTIDTDPQNQDQQGTPGNGPEKTEKTVPYERFAKVNDAKKQAEETLTVLVDELKDDVPEQFKGLIPNLPPAELVKWLRNATKSGIFTAKPEPSGPDSKRPGGKPAADYSNMSAQQRMAAGYSN